jgi:hypothetical protein
MTVNFEVCAFMPGWAVTPFTPGCDSCHTFQIADFTGRYLAILREPPRPVKQAVLKRPKARIEIIGKILARPQTTSGRITDFATKPVCPPSMGKSFAG